ncbi:hypothetical protein Hanom_Chr03g00234061 [Helianthus anomalus]
MFVQDVKKVQKKKNPDLDPNMQICDDQRVKLYVLHLNNQVIIIKNHIYNVFVKSANEQYTLFLKMGGGWLKN